MRQLALRAHQRPPNAAGYISAVCFEWGGCASSVLVMHVTHWHPAPIMMPTHGRSVRVLRRRPRARLLAQCQNTRTRPLPLFGIGQEKSVLLPAKNVTP